MIFEYLSLFITKNIVLCGKFLLFLFSLILFSHLILPTEFYINEVFWFDFILLIPPSYVSVTKNINIYWNFVFKNVS